jgi:hypothetical protein
MPMSNTACGVPVRRGFAFGNAVPIHVPWFTTFGGGRMMKTDRFRRLLLVLLALMLAAVACDIPGATPAGEAATDTPTPFQPTDTPTAAVPLDTDTPTPLPPTLTPTQEPETATPTLSAWLFVYGTWSGCTDSPQPLVPYYATPCAGASGDFAALFLKPHCVIGEYCGNFVKGTFASEYILLKLTLLGIQGSTVWMHGDAGSGMYSSFSTDVTIEREGNAVRIVEKAAQQYIHVLPGGCDPVIKTETAGGCFEYLV